MAQDSTVERNDDTSRYEIRVGGEVVGFLAFEDDPDGNVVLTHTEIDGDRSGEGLGTELVADALADLAQRGNVVVPQCPFVAHHLKENEVAGLVVAWSEEDDAAESAAQSEPA